MRRYIAIIAVLLFSLHGCEKYHPYYDGQAMRIYERNYGLIEEDGVHLNIPLNSWRVYQLEIYGGKGKNHEIKISDPKIMDYVYESAESESFIGFGISPVTLILKPLNVGNTSINITDKDTNESITIELHVVDSLVQNFS